MRKVDPTSGTTSNKAVTVSVGLLLLTTFFFIVNTFIFLRDSNRDAEYLELTSDLRVLSHQLSISSREATLGDSSAFVTLKSASEQFEKSHKVLGGGNGTLPGVEEMIPQESRELRDVWNQVRDSANIIVKNRDRILFLHDVASTLNASIPELQQEYSDVVDIMIRNRASADQVAIAQKQLLIAERISRNIDNMFEGGDAAKVSAEQFNKDASIFGGVLVGMLDGRDSIGVDRVNNAKARKSLNKIKENFDFVSSSVNDIFKATPNLLKAKSAANVVLDSSPEMLKQIDVMADGIRDLSSRRAINADTAIIAGAVILLLLSVIGIQLYRNTVKRFSEQKFANEKNQQAIQRLLNEIGDLADGDLTASATVSEDFTGAIADSINFTIEQLREIVSSINATTVKVDSAAKNTQDKALSLAKASEAQVQEITSASGAIKDMASTMGKMSTDASESATVAASSVQIAKSGSRVVQNTINGMDTIREQIQDTSKRIKRLGESSQEIGDIVSLINDIADQTNILALNASIQASMAGEAGRGFAVVADEVQRLAERSSAATRQIEALVKTIQSDTNEAVISMENTTKEVVNGAGLAHDAGVALEEIEKVSQNLSELIESISSSAQDQANSAGCLSKTMNTIKDITTRTSSGTTEAAKRVGALSSMTMELRNSVAGFKLPSMQFRSAPDRQEQQDDKAKAVDGRKSA